jgi:quinol monooxygenase YgiN
MIAIVWQFDVKPGKEQECEQFFGADGEWSAASRQSRSYLGSSFLHDQNNGSRYLMIEYWSEMLVYEQHKAYRQNAMTDLEAKRAELVTAIEPLGIFTALDVPDRWGPTWSRRT